jgi:hypothetical protein
MKAKLIKQILFGLGISLLLTAAPAFAHHPFPLEFDWKKPVTLTGTVTKVEWMNPHAVRPRAAHSPSAWSMPA